MSKTEVLSQSTGPGYEKVDNIQLQDMAATKVDNNIGPPMIKEQQLAGPSPQGPKLKPALKQTVLILKTTAESSGYNEQWERAVPTTVHIL